MLTEAEFAIVAREVKTRSGAVLTKELAGPAEARLAPLSRREGFGSVSEMLSAARIRPDGALYAGIADALAQSDTRFFRDKASFTRLREDILPKAMQRRGHERVRIWSAACSTGQEPYSIAMLIEEMKSQGHLIASEIIATDLSERLLGKARTGLYTQFEVQRGLPIRTLIAHFEKSGDLWRISDRLRANVRFEQHNLLKHPGGLGQFDIIVCAHVLSSFDEPTRLATLARLADALTPDGVLLLGAGEKLPEGVEGLAHEDGVVISKAAARRAA